MPALKVTTTRAEIIRQKLADDILRGVYAPGAKLDETKLAERFKLSRTPVREALRQLISAGLIEWRPHRGAIVSLPDEALLAEMFEVMGELEAICARFAAQRMAPAERVRLQAIHDASAQAVRSENRDRYRELNFDFHDIIYRASHNDFLSTTSLSVRQRIAPFRRAQFEVAGRLEKSFQEHDAILRAIASGDADGAAAQMRAHVRVVRAASHDYVMALETPAAAITAPKKAVTTGGR